MQLGGRAAVLSFIQQICTGQLRRTGQNATRWSSRKGSAREEFPPQRNEDAYMGTKRTSDQKVREGWSQKMGHQRKSRGHPHGSQEWRGRPRKRTRFHRRRGLRGGTASNSIVILGHAGQEARLKSEALAARCFAHCARQFGFYLLALGIT